MVSYLYQFPDGETVANEQELVAQVRDMKGHLDLEAVTIHVYEVMEVGRRHVGTVQADKVDQYGGFNSNWVG